MTPMKHFDHLIIGTGQAMGTLLGGLLQKEEKNIAVVEKASVGGSCVNYGCTPTKALVASAKAFRQAQRGAEFGFATGALRVDYPRVKDRMDEIRHASRDGLMDWLEGESAVSFIRGEARFVAEKEVLIEEERYAADRIYINVGTHPFEPSIKGLAEVPWLDTERLLDLEKAPQHLIVIGGGYVGVELGQVYSRLGCEVTVFQRNSQLLPKEDRDVAEAIQDFLKEEGLAIHTNADIKTVARAEMGLQVCYQWKGEERLVTGSHLLIAAGRRPNTQKLGIEAAGLRLTEKGYIDTDDHCGTEVEGVYALGDVNGKGAFTHTAVNDAEVVLDHLYGGQRKVSDRDTIYALFTDPPLGRVGLSEQEALKRGQKVLKAVHSMADISRAKEMSETRGLVKLLVDANSDKIIGAAVLGPGGDEIVNMIAAVMHSNISYKEYRKAVLVHPTVSELMPFILDGLEPVE